MLAGLPSRRRPFPEVRRGHESEAVTTVLKEISTSLFEKYEPVGVGEDWRYDGKLSFGKALHFREELVHLSAFRK
ncbi:MAG: DUF6569 family protein [Bacteroidota bacterium]